jgi:hypothetical protein
MVGFVPARFCSEYASESAVLDDGRTLPVLQRHSGNRKEEMS